MEEKLLNQPTAKKIAKIVTRRQQALQLYFDGQSMRQIAEALDCSLGTVSSDINEELYAYSTDSRILRLLKKQEEYAKVKAYLSEKAFAGDYPAMTLYLKALEAEQKMFRIKG